MILRSSKEPHLALSCNCALKEIRQKIICSEGMSEKICLNESSNELFYRPRTENNFRISFSSACFFSFFSYDKKRTLSVFLSLSLLQSEMKKLNRPKMS